MSVGLIYESNIIHMEKIYSKKLDQCKLVKAKPSTVQFLLDYSKSLHIVDYNGVQFENNKN